MIELRRAFPALAGSALLLLGLGASADSDLDLLDINEGELRFLNEAPADPPHLQSTHIIISDDSLQTGWLHMRQCHYQLAPVRAMQVLFRKDRVRNLKIIQADNIGRAWIEDASVQLTDVKKDAVLCVQSENRSLERNDLDGSYEWHGGPYLRRFLDGYFPMHVKVAIDYPADRLAVRLIEPAPLRLKAVSVPGHVRIDTVFEGKLSIAVQFAQGVEPKPGIGWN